MYFLFIYATADDKTVKAYVETSNFQKKYLRAGSSTVIRKTFHNNNWQFYAE